MFYMSVLRAKIFLFRWKSVIFVIESGVKPIKMYLVELDNVTFCKKNVVWVLAP